MSNPNNIFIINDVINDLFDAEKSLVNPLMRLNYFGRLTKNEELIKFTNNEINGYKDQGAIVPGYRRTIGNLIVEVQAYLNRQTMEIPISVLDSPFDEALRYIDVREGIATVEKMAREMLESNGDKNEFYRPVPMEMLHIIQPALTKLYKSNTRLDAIGAKIIGNGNIILDIQSFIRTKLLEFVMQIAEEFGYEIKIKDYNEKQESNNQTIVQFMSTNITSTGDGNVINTGEKVKIDAKITINKGNKEKLSEFLQKNGLSEQDTAELVEIIDTEEPNSENKIFGAKVNGWIGKMVGKALDGSWNVGIGAAGSLLGEAIGKYYGF
jgi:hypothetical protein